MGNAVNFILLSVLVCSVLSYSGERGMSSANRLWRSDDANGGAGLSGKNGQPGMNGCPGGTRPFSDGKYYLPGTHEECHPARRTASHQSGHLVRERI